ncbi:MAG TPA: hypothetical protein VMF56_08655 [Acidobacteriaceae bacterium]|nr:hypothetical protein [Acidobacteriaceae bacterium]
MKKQCGAFAGLCLLFTGIGLAGSGIATAQDSKPNLTPPNVLVVESEMLKPGMAGMAHQKTESAFVQAMTKAKSPEHYFAATSMSGPSRALFFLPYDSFADWEKSNAAMMSDSTLAAEFDSAMQADGKLLESFTTIVFRYEPDMSVSPNVDLAQMRYMEITVIDIKPGHEAEWKELAKLHNEVYGQVPNTHFAMWEEYFGNEGGVYIATAPLKDLAEIDAHRTAAMKAWAAASAETKKRMGDLEASAFASIHTNLYSMDPKMSYAPDRWKTASPDFWGKQ